MIRRLRLKFVCINMAIVTLMLCAIFAMVFFFTRDNLERESIGMMQALAQEPMRPGGPDERPEGVRLPFFTLELDEDGGIADAWGGYYDLTDGELLEKLLALAEAGDGNTGVLEDYGLRYCRVWARGTQYIVFADMSSERSVIANLVKNSLLIGALSFAAFLVVSLLLARWAVRPVELAWERQRQFVADASHELKTPLTVILSNAQLLGEAEGDPALRSRLRENILSMSARMRSLVESLLDLARVDSGLAGQTLSRVDLSRVVSEAILPFEPLFYERGLVLSSSVEPGIAVKGSAERLSQAVGVLLDNAQKYASPGGSVSVTLSRQSGRHCLIAVENSGEPLSPAERRDIFKRFYRADAARSSGGSYGLGLSIARGIVEAHRGRIWAEALPGGNRFCIRLRVQKSK